MFIVEKFLNSLIRDYGKHTLSTDGGTWYPYACKLLKVKHHLHSTYEKSIIERTIQNTLLRTERNASMMMIITLHVRQREISVQTNPFEKLAQFIVDDIIRK